MCCFLQGHRSGHDQGRPAQQSGNHCKVRHCQICRGTLSFTAATNDLFCTCSPHSRTCPSSLFCCHDGSWVAAETRITSCSLSQVLTATSTARWAGSEGVSGGCKFDWPVRCGLLQRLPGGRQGHRADQERIGQHPVVLGVQLWQPPVCGVHLSLLTSASSRANLDRSKMFLVNLNRTKYP